MRNAGRERVAFRARFWPAFHFVRLIGMKEAKSVDRFTWLKHCEAEAGKNTEITC